MKIDAEHTALFGALNEISDEGLLALSAEGEILSWNAGACALLGMSREQALGKRLDVALCDVRAATALERTRRDGAAQFRWSPPDGRSGKVTIDLRLTADANGATKLVASVRCATSL